MLNLSFPTRCIAVLFAVIGSITSIIVGSLDKKSCNVAVEKISISVNTYLIVFGVVTLLGESIFIIEFIHKKWPHERLAKAICHSKWFTILIEVVRIVWHIITTVSFFTNSHFDECSHYIYAIIVYFLYKWHLFYKINDLIHKFKKKNQINRTSEDQSNDMTRTISAEDLYGIEIEYSEYPER